ncbi:Plant invertase/pectin methylesterase inhibitor superfamily protein [Striga hermonthica]|uniref:Plant invertase/pectin methylesterase inhibitor superfamily protein n=1 Tax=Striga hermonthica TaxID=68872 RepID=A0A9N7MVI0_STRHE|nr:Plant invertase/pectin methylesterase inhibitor superfamily protein [Striga hermonthica]
MKASPLLVAAVVVAAALFLNTAAYPPLSPPPNPNTYKNFVRAQCNDTKVQYHALCYQTLAPCANSIHGNLGKLTHQALKISSARVQAMASCISGQKRTAYGEDNNITKALGDCNTTLAAAQSYIQQSLQQMESPAPPKQGGIVGANVETWVSAAITYEETCLDSLKQYSTNATSGAWQTCNSKYLVENVTSNALAFLNKYYAPPPPPHHPPPPPHHPPPPPHHPPPPPHHPPPPPPPPPPPKY